MSANIETYIGREAAWHRLGIVTGDWLKWSQIARDTNLDFDVRKEQRRHPRKGHLIPSWDIFRTDNDGFLGVVGKGYTTIPHQRGFELIDHIMGAQDGAHYETAGALGAGEVVWGLADLNAPFQTRGGDKHENYLLFVTSHDGSKPFMVRLTSTRVVCQNTLTIALSQKAQNAFRVRHTSGWKPRVEDAMVVLEDAKKQALAIGETLDRLAHKKVDKVTVATVLDRLFPTPKGKTMSGKTQNNVVRILELFESNDKNAIPEIKGTALNLFNSVTEFTDHYRHTRVAKDETKGKPENTVNAIKERSRAISSIFGSGNEFKSEALKIILDLEGNMHEVSAPVSVSVPALNAPTTQTIETEGNDNISKLLSLVDLGEEASVI